MWDIYTFVQAMKSPNQQFVLIGGSYPGALVAWYQNYFNDASAIWSSSGVVHSVEDFSAMDAVIAESASKSSTTTRNCLTAI